MRCDECGSGLLVRSGGAAVPDDAWECLGCGQTNIRGRAGAAVTIGDLLAGRGRPGAGDG